MASAGPRSCFGLVALQVFLGIFSHSIPFVIVLHVLNAFAIFGMALHGRPQRVGRRRRRLEASVAV